LTLENEQQALDRVGGIHGNKGEEAAVTAIKMIALNRKLK
jgi:6,7-dimethyl-8-ribityllumazine synthase